MAVKNKWTIVQNTRALRYYEFACLSGDVLRTIEGCFELANFSKWEREKAFIVLKLLECFLQITGKKFILNARSCSELDLISKYFIGGLWSDTFFAVKVIKRHTYTCIYIKVLHALQFVVPKLTIPIIRIERTQITDDVRKLAREFEQLSLIDEHAYYWRGWWAYNKNNDAWFIPLNGVYKCYGREFTERLFELISDLYAGRARSLPYTIVDFLRWLPSFGYTAEQFNKPLDVQYMFQNFLSDYLTDGYKKGKGQSIKNLVVNWRRFIVFVEKYLLGTIFAEPYGKLVTPEPVNITGSERRIKVSAEGIAVKEKLLTEIPLHITDEEAMELLFQQIQTDYNHIVTVARRLTNDLWRRYQRRKELAVNGIIKPVRGITAMDEKARQWIIHKNNPDWLSNASATFEDKGFVHDCNNRPLVSSSYSLDRKDIAFELGLPTSYALLPYMVLLVAEHPNIVPSFLTEFELYNKQGKLTGFVKLDGCYVLDGRKRRRGVTHAQQIIPLTPVSKLLVEQLIAITDCVRHHLKERGDDYWRYLFLSCSKGFTPGKMQPQYAQAKKSQGTFYQELLIPSNGITQERAAKLSSRFDLGALRASKAVLIYLQTKSVKAMSEALGHKEYSSKSLSHYLPGPIFDFFQSRWIRIFQQGIIVESMQESPYLMEATEFNNIDELHEFIKNHALKKIPAHLEEYDNINSLYTAETGEIIFNINIGILTLLLSLEQAVAQSKKPVCKVALYWAKVTKCLVQYIESGSQYVSGADFVGYLKAAKSLINPSELESIIYA